MKKRAPMVPLAFCNPRVAGRGTRVAILKASGVGLRAVGPGNFLQLAAEGPGVLSDLCCACTWGVFRRERAPGREVFLPACL